MFCYQTFKQLYPLTEFLYFPGLLLGETLYVQSTRLAILRIAGIAVACWADIALLTTEDAAALAHGSQRRQGGDFAIKAPHSLHIAVGVVRLEGAETVGDKWCRIFLRIVGVQDFQEICGIEESAPVNDMQRGFRTAADVAIDGAESDAAVDGAQVFGEIFHGHAMEVGAQGLVGEP